MKITLHGLRTPASPITIDFKRPMHILLGANDTGKTSILKTLALLANQLDHLTATPHNSPTWTDLVDRELHIRCEIPENKISPEADITFIFRHKDNQFQLRWAVYTFKSGKILFTAKLDLDGKQHVTIDGQPIPLHIIPFDGFLPSWLEAISSQITIPPIQQEIFKWIVLSHRLFSKTFSRITWVNPSSNFAFTPPTKTRDQHSLNRWCKKYGNFEAIFHKNQISIQRTNEPSQPLFMFGQGFIHFALVTMACWQWSKRQSVNMGTLILENPELGTHATLQRKLADMFADMIKHATKRSSTFRCPVILLETHSQTIIKSLGQAVRFEKMPPNVDISILFNKHIQSSAYAYDGFLVHWPYGFFEPYEE